MEVAVSMVVVIGRIASCRVLSVKVAVGNHLGSSELERLSLECQARRKARKEDAG